VPKYMEHYCEMLSYNSVVKEPMPKHDTKTGHCLFSESWHEATTLKLDLLTSTQHAVLYAFIGSWKQDWLCCLQAKVILPHTHSLSF